MKPNEPFRVNLPRFPVPMENAHAKARGDIQSVEVERPWLVLVDPLRVSPYVAEQGTGLGDFELEQVLQGGALAKFDAQRVWSLRPCCHRAKLSQTKQHA
jgi:hypothetical protein